MKHPVPKLLTTVLIACLSVQAAGGENKQESGTANIQPKGAIGPMYFKGTPSLPTQIHPRTPGRSLGIAVPKTATKHLDIAIPAARTGVRMPNQTKTLTGSRSTVTGPSNSVPNVLKHPPVFIGNKSKIEKIDAGLPGHIDPKSANKGLAGIYGTVSSTAPGLITSFPGPRQRIQQQTSLPGFDQRKGFNPAGFDATSKSVSPLTNPKSPAALGISPTTGLLNPRGTLNSSQSGSGRNGQLSGLSNPKQAWAMNGKTWFVRMVNRVIRTGIDGPGEVKGSQYNPNLWMLTSDHPAAGIIRIVNPATVYAVGVGSVWAVNVDDVATGCVGPLGASARCSGTDSGATSDTKRQPGSNNDSHARDTDGDGVADQSYDESVGNNGTSSNSTDSTSDDETEKNKTAGSQTTADSTDTTRDNDTAKDDESQPRDCAAGWTDTESCHNTAALQAALETAQQQTLLGGHSPVHLDWKTLPTPDSNGSTRKKLSQMDFETAKKKRLEQVTNPNPLGTPSRYISDEEAQERYRQKQGQVTDPSPES